MILMITVVAEGKPCGNWRSGFARLGLLLPKADRLALLEAGLGRKRPLPIGAHRRLIRRYQKILRQINRLRRCFLRRYRKSHTWRSRKRVLRQVEITLRQVLEEALLPLWIGTPWDYYGTAEVPHQKAIACGYYVTHLLLGLGFRFPENFKYKKTMHIYEFAKLTATGMIRRLSSRGLTYSTSNRPISAFKVPLKEKGPGIYILGLDNHVGLVLYDGNRAHFWHSAYDEPGVWAKREDLYHSPVAKASAYRLIGKLSPVSYRKWLYRHTIYVKRRHRRR